MKYKSLTQRKAEFKKAYPYLSFEKIEIWRRRVYQRYEKCVCCQKKRKKYAHHVLPKSKYLEKAYDVSDILSGINSRASD